MSDNSLPIIRLEVEGMRRQIVTALTEHQAEMDEMVKQAVEEATKPEHVKQVVRKEVSRTLDKVVQEEVQNFFRYDGEGRKVIAKAVKQKLLDKESFTPLDEVD